MNFAIWETIHSICSYCASGDEPAIRLICVGTQQPCDHWGLQLLVWGPLNQQIEGTIQITTNKSFVTFKSRLPQINHVFLSNEKWKNINYFTYIWRKWFLGIQMTEHIMQNDSLPSNLQRKLRGTIINIILPPRVLFYRCKFYFHRHKFYFSAASYILLPWDLFYCRKFFLVSFILLPWVLYYCCKFYFSAASFILLPWVLLHCLKFYFTAA